MWQWVVILGIPIIVILLVVVGLVLGGPKFLTLFRVQGGSARLLTFGIVLLGLGVLAVAAGIVAIQLFAGAAATEPNLIWAVASALAGASLVIGALLGFLFGIPRTLSSNDLPEPDQGLGMESAANNDRSTSYHANTNLEQISDWLTKILVGVGLTQLGEIPGAVRGAARSLTPSLGGLEASGVFGVALVLYFLVTGFLLGYLATRVWLPGVFRRSDPNVREQLQDLNQGLGELNAKIDTVAQDVTAIRSIPAPGP